MLGPKQEAQGALFYEFSIDDHVPQDQPTVPAALSDKIQKHIYEIV